MATSSSSPALVNWDAKTVAQDPILIKGRRYTILGTYEKVAGNTNGDYVLLARVHKSWSIESLFLANDALTGATDINVGLVADAAVGDGVTDVDENCYADAVDISAGVAFTDRAFTTRGIEKCGQYVWQDAGAASAEAAAEWYRIAIHFQSATTATGTISWRIGVVTPS